MNEEPVPRLAPVDMDLVSSSKCRSSRLFSGARALKRPMTLVFRSCSRTKSGCWKRRTCRLEGRGFQVAES